MAATSDGEGGGLLGVVTQKGYGSTHLAPEQTDRLYRFLKTLDLDTFDPKQEIIMRMTFDVDSGENVDKPDPSEVKRFIGQNDEFYFYENLSGQLVMLCNFPSEFENFVPYGKSQDSKTYAKKHNLIPEPMQIRHQIGPRDVPQLRNYLLEQWGPGKVFTLLAGMHARNSPDRTVDSTANIQANFIKNATNDLRQSAMWWVSAEMMDVLASAAPNIPDEVVWHDIVAPADRGFVVFEKSFHGLDSTNPDNDLTVDALCWGPEQMVPIPSRPDGPRAISITSYQRVDSAMLENWWQETGVSPPSWAYIGKSEWPVGDALNQQPYAELSEQQVLSYIEDRRLLVAFFTLIAQEAIAETEYHPIPRPDRRRADRAGVQKEAQNLRVITLRRKHRNVAEDDDLEPIEDEGPGRNYSHRWIVNPFYRWQRVGPGRKERRLTLVSGHVRGPEDKPLKLKQEVRAWTRM